MFIVSPGPQITNNESVTKWPHIAHLDIKTAKIQPSLLSKRQTYGIFGEVN
jgi:hypothetical protein